MSTNAGDTYLYQSSFNSMRDKTPFSKREFISSPDVNSGGVYGNQIIFDLSQFANQTTGLLDFSNAVLQIPVCLTASTLAASGSAPTCLDGMLALKNGSWQLIHSLNVNIDGQDLLQPASFLNNFISYKLLTSMSTDDLRNWGDSHLFTGPDNTSSWVYNNVEAGTITNTGNLCSRILNGNGLCNNSPYIKVGRLQTPKEKNNGYWELGNSKFLDRIALINDRPDDVYVSANAVSPPNVQQNLGSIRDEQNYINELKNYTRSTGTTGANFYQQWFVMANVKLSFLSDLFQNIGLVRGLYAKINVTVNTGAFIVRMPTAADNIACALHMRPNEVFFQNFNPVQVCERALDSANKPVTFEGEQFLISVGIASPFPTSVAGYTSHASLGANKHPLQNCRITIPVYHTKPDEIIAYLESTKEKRIEYTDIYTSLISNIGPGQPFSSLISNGSQNVIGLLITPVISSVSNGRVTGNTNVPNEVQTSGFSTNLSPFVGEMVCPLSITQLSVLFGSEQILPNLVNYSWENFVYHFQDFNRINGNNSMGIASGLISQKQWEDYYRYHFVSLNRRPEEDGMPKGITVGGVNNSKVTCDYIVQVLTKKSFIVNASTGRITK